MIYYFYFIFINSYIKLLNIKYKITFMKHVNAKKKSKLISLKRKIKSNIFLIHTIELFEENIPQHLIQFTLFLNNKDYGLSETNHYLIALKLLLTTFTISFSSMRFSSNATKVFFSNSLSVSIKLLRFCTNLILLIVQTIPLAIILGNFRTQTIIFICIHVFTHGKKKKILLKKKPIRCS